MSQTIDPTDVKRPQFELREDGEIHFNKKGRSTLLAKFDAETGILVFESFDADHKYREQICRAIRENIEGELTGNAIKAFRIAGRPVDKRRAGEPPPPKKDKMLGDKTPAYVRWLFKWRPQAAYARYGVLLDSNGDPITAHCIRTEQGLIQADTTGKALKVFGDGKDALSQTTIEQEDGILALRQTCMTFLKKEQVSAIAGEEDQDDDEPLDEEGSDAQPEQAEEKPVKTRRGAKQIDAAAEDE